MFYNKGCFMISVYEKCPTFENEKYKLSMVEISDAKDLLTVYSDVQAVSFFNCDNCGGEDFYYTTEQRMEEAIRYWLWEYSRCGFVRWTIIDKHKQTAIGTIELFHRDADDYFTNCGLLRLDLRSDYEKTVEIINILSLILEPTFSVFDCDKIATKAVMQATERRKALSGLHFQQSEECLIGHDGTRYSDYFVLHKKN